MNNYKPYQKSVLALSHTIEGKHGLEALKLSDLIFNTLYEIEPGIVELGDIKSELALIEDSIKDLVDMAYARRNRL
jgi:hypothetical protein